MTTNCEPGGVTSRDYRLAALLGLLALAWYASTLAPTVVWGDPAKLTVYAHTLYLRVWASNHALHNMVGWVWGQLPFRDYAYGQNLLSAVFAALAVAAVYVAMRHLTASRVGAALGAAALGASHTFWWLGVVAESYSLLFFLLAVTLLAALRWAESRNDRWLYLLAFVIGLGIADHAIMALFVPAFALYCWCEDPRLAARGGTLLGIALGLLLGLSPLLGIFVYSLRWYGVGELLQQMAFGWSVPPYWSGAKALRETVSYPLYLCYQFPGLGIVLGLMGASALYRARRNAFLLLAVVFVLDVGFSVGHMFYQRQFEILVPSYLVFAMAVGAGAGQVWERTRAVLTRGIAQPALGTALVAGLAVVPMLTYYAVPHVLKRTGRDPLGARYMPYRDNARYFFLPDKAGYTGAAQFGREVLHLLPAEAVLLADFTPGTVLRYFQTVQGLRRDVLVVDVEGGTPAGARALEAVGQYAGRRPVYLTDYRSYPQFFAIAELRKHYEFAPRGPVFALIPSSDPP